MRVSKEEKAASHERIVAMANSMFKKDGIENTGVAAVMQAAGLTHGGFYRHFASKSDLVHAALQKSNDVITDYLTQLIDEKGAKAAVQTYIQEYLSAEHLNNPDQGCPFAALGPETARGTPGVQAVMAKGRSKIVDLLATGYAGDAAQGRHKALALLSTLVGAVILARATPDPVEQETILSAARATALASL